MAKEPTTGREILMRRDAQRVVERAKYFIGPPNVPEIKRRFEEMRDIVGILSDSPTERT